jgi:ketosteroid isomerase-like protein
VIAPGSYDKASTTDARDAASLRRYKATFAEAEDGGRNMGMILMCPTGDVLIAPKTARVVHGVDDFLANFRAEQRTVWQDWSACARSYSVDPERIYAPATARCDARVHDGAAQPAAVRRRAGDRRLLQDGDGGGGLAADLGGHALPVAILQPGGDSDANVEQARNARDVTGTAG